MIKLDQKRRFYLFFALITLLVVVGLIRTVVSDLFAPKKILPVTPQAVMTDVTVTEMDVNGIPNSILVTPTMTHYEEGDVTDMTTPHLTLFSPPGSPWQITSVYGRTTDGIDKIYMWQDVVMTRPGSTFNPPETLLTPDFTVYPKTKYGETASPVKLLQPGMVVTGVGATADLLKKEIDLLADTKTVYTQAPPAQKSPASSSTTGN